MVSVHAPQLFGHMSPPLPEEKPAEKDGRVPRSAIWLQAAHVESINLPSLLLSDGARTRPPPEETGNLPMLSQ